MAGPSAACRQCCVDGTADTVDAQAVVPGGRRQQRLLVQRECPLRHCANLCPALAAISRSTCKIPTSASTTTVAPTFTAGTPRTSDRAHGCPRIPRTPFSRCQHSDGCQAASTARTKRWTARASAWRCWQATLRSQVWIWSLWARTEQAQLPSGGRPPVAAAAASATSAAAAAAAGLQTARRALRWAWRGRARRLPRPRAAGRATSRRPPRRQSSQQRCMTRWRWMACSRQRSAQCGSACAPSWCGCGCGAPGSVAAACSRALWWLL